MKKETKNIQKLHDITDINHATILKARESWSMLTIMSEFIESTERLSEISPAVTIFGSARLKPESAYYQQCVELARRLSDAGLAVISGGGPGIMEAANKGAFDGKSLSIGLNIELPQEQHPNPWQNISLNYRHFFARKVALAKHAEAFVVFPGGFGTLDEMSEILTLIQTKKTRQTPFILVGTAFWQGFLDWIRSSLIPSGLISEGDIDLIQVLDDNDTIIKSIFTFYETHEMAPSSEDRQKMFYL